MQVFKFQRSSCKISFLFPPPPPECPGKEGSALRSIPYPPLPFWYPFQIPCLEYYISLNFCKCTVLLIWMNCLVFFTAIKCICLRGLLVVRSFYRPKWEFSLPFYTWRLKKLPLSGQASPEGHYEEKCPIHKNTPTPSQSGQPAGISSGYSFPFLDPFECQVSWISGSVKQRTAASKPHNTTTDHTVKYNDGRVRYYISDTVYHNLESKIQFSAFCQILHFHELTVIKSRAHTQSGLHKYKNSWKKKTLPVKLLYKILFLFPASNRA